MKRLALSAITIAMLILTACPKVNPEGPKEIATKISEATGCDVVQVIGGIIVVFRINLILRQKAAEKKKRQIL